MIADLFKYFWLCAIAILFALIAIVYMAVYSAHSSGYAEGYCNALGGNPFAGREYCIIKDELIEIE